MPSSADARRQPETVLELPAQLCLGWGASQELFRVVAARRLKTACRAASCRAIWTTIGGACSVFVRAPAPLRSRPSTGSSPRRGPSRSSGAAACRQVATGCSTGRGSAPGSSAAIGRRCHRTSRASWTGPPPRSCTSNRSIGCRSTSPRRSTSPTTRSSVRAGRAARARHRHRRRRNHRRRR